MNILQLREILSRGGIEILLFDICNNTDEHNMKIKLATFGKGEFDNEFHEKKISIIKLKRKYPIDLGLIKSLRQVITDNKIDIVHSHQAVEGLHAFFATRGLDVKNVISHHGSTYPLKDKMAMKFLVPRVHANIAVSKSYLSRLENIEGFDTSKNFHVLYNGIDEKKFKVAPTKIKNELGISSSSIILGMVGNFYGSGRDQYTVCKALPQLYNKFNNLHFIFIGGWSNDNSENFQLCLDYCKSKKILTKTHFIGSRKDIGNILNALDIFVYSSNHDTFGISVIEAMLAGKPVIVNDISPMLEISNNGEFAEVFTSKDPNSLYHSVQTLIEDLSYRKSLAIRGKNWATKNFTISTHIEQLKLIYENLLK